MTVIKATCFRGGPGPDAGGLASAPRPAVSPLRAVGGIGPAATPALVFEIECAVEFEGAAHRFTFEVTARDEDQATDLAIEMLDRARVTDTRQKTL